MGAFACWKPLSNVAKKLQPHGCYSIERLRRMNSYTEGTARCRLVLVCLLTSLPCIALAMLVESVPLDPPEAGPFKNYAFWIRASTVTYFVDYSVLLQMSHSLARLKMKHRSIILIALAGSIASFAAVFSVGVWVAFPVPFSMLVASPPSCVVIVVSFWYMWGRQWRSDAGLRRDLVRHVLVFAWQVALTFIYPLYIFGFTSLSDFYQTLFVLMLPTIKAAGESWISYTLADQNDIKPEVVIFNVEVFNALYVSCAVQNSTSPATTAVLMLVDVLHFWLAMTGTMRVLSEVSDLMARIPARHPLAGKSFVEVAMWMLAMEDRGEMNSQLHSCGTSKERDLLRLKAAPSSKSLRQNKVSGEFRAPIRAETVSLSRVNPNGGNNVKQIMPKATQVYPLSPMQQGVNVFSSSGTKSKSSRPYRGPDFLFSRQERVKFINTTARVLYITEYLILVEYTEAMLPMVYALYLVLAFHTPNRVYIQSFDGLSSDQLYTNVSLVLAYSILEFVSLIIATAVLKRMLGISSLHQLGFVLETQATMIQSKLMLWFVYVMQVPLVHVGTDFSFKFKWAHAAH